jgi:hypothetical protein
VLHKDQLFPGAKLTISPSEDLSNYTHRERLLVVLSDPVLPTELRATHVGKLLGKDWGDVSGRLINETTQQMLRNLGWTYVPGRGPGGASFRRVGANPSITSADRG